MEKRAHDHHVEPFRRAYIVERLVFVLCALAADLHGRLISQISSRLCACRLIMGNGLRPMQMTNLRLPLRRSEDSSAESLLIMSSTGKIGLQKYVYSGFKISDAHRVD